MSWKNTAGLCALVSAIGIGVGLQFAAPVRAAAPVLRQTYQSVGAGVNEKEAIIWLLSSDGNLKICRSAATDTSMELPVCSPSVVP
jgi:hypothetical protein